LASEQIAKVARNIEIGKADIRKNRTWRHIMKGPEIQK
jgi:hypothetical protein